jgi:hypothetical protein
MAGVDARPGAPAVAAIEALLERQRRAILDRDAAALDQACRALEAEVRVLRAPPASTASRAALERVRAGLRLNAEMLSRAQAVNNRALSTIFGAEGVYRPGGDGGLARSSRPLDTA